MIIRMEFGRLRITLQSDHGAVTGELARAWGGDRFCAPRPQGPVHQAAALHDDGWLDWEEQPRVMPDAGRPYDFLTLRPDEHVAIYERGIRLALEAHPYAGLLVSLHGTGLYRRRYGHMPHLVYKDVDPAFRAVTEAYVERQEALQQELLADLRPDPAALWTHYRWLQAWDLLSLFLSLSDPAEQPEMLLGVVPLSPGGPEVPLTVRGIGPGCYTVSPWPFARQHLEVVVPVRYVADRAYESDEAFQAAFAGAPTVSLTAALVPEP